MNNSIDVEEAFDNFNLYYQDFLIFYKMGIYVYFFNTTVLIYLVPSPTSCFT